MLAPGESVLLHSDGIVEAHDPDRAMFGFPRLKETVADHAGGQALIDHVLAELETFTGRAPSRRTTSRWSRSSARGRRRVLAEFELPSAPGNEREAIERVASAVAGLGLEPVRLERLKTAVGEATMNAMEHGNEYRADRPVSIRVLHTGDRLRVEVSDLGGAAELHAAEAPDLGPSSPASRRRAAGGSS